MMKPMTMMQNNALVEPSSDGPIPGENFTSDTKNYPWHRPPEITSMDKGIEAAIKQLSTRTGTFGLLNSLQSGITVVQATTMFVTSGIGTGKWTPDFAILLAGPVSRMMEIMAKDARIEYNMGLEEDSIPTITFLNEVAKVSDKTVTSASEELKSNEMSIKADAKTTPEPTGFMSNSEEDM